MDCDYLGILGRKINAELCESDLLAVKGVLDEVKREIFKDISKLAGKEGRKKLTVDYEGLYSMDRNFIRSSKSLVFRVSLIPNLSSKERISIENYANDCPFNVEVYDLKSAREDHSSISKKQNRRSALGRYKVVNYAY